MSTKASTGTGAGDLELEALRRWLAARADRDVGEPASSHLIAGEISDPTYEITDPAPQSQVVVVLEGIGQMVGPLLGPALEVASTSSVRGLRG